MSTPRNPRQSPAEPAVDRHFRRRVVLELTADELPLLDAAQQRHGTKRSALIAALAAEQRIEQLEQRLADAERAAAEQAQGAGRAKQTTAKAQAKLERELAAARKQLEKQDADLKVARNSADQAADGYDEQLRDLEDALAERDAEITELERYAVDGLYCARCQHWVPPAGWQWQTTDDGDEYAFHKQCGDHPPAVLSASSWLAHRRA